jgi:hypothetical protein
MSTKMFDGRVQFCNWFCAAVFSDDRDSLLTYFTEHVT